jgi:hypothetical protein
MHILGGFLNKPEVAVLTSGKCRISFKLEKKRDQFLFKQVSFEMDKFEFFTFLLLTSGDYQK